MDRNRIGGLCLLSCLFVGGAGFAAAQLPASTCPGRLGDPIFESAVNPTFATAAAPPAIAPAKLQPSDQLLPINFPAAMRLAAARPLVIDAALAALESESGRLIQAQALWLPTLRVGLDYQRHDGGLQTGVGVPTSLNNDQQLLLGAGATAAFAFTDAIFEPLAARQLVRSREFDVQTAKNEALLAVASAYFQVQQGRGVLAGLQDSVDKARALMERISKLGKGLVSPIETDRVRTTLLDFEQLAATARQDWRTSSAELIRVLRLNPASVVVPTEPASLTVTLVPASVPLDTLIPIALTNRPELASQQAVVQATILRLRQERVRPLIPSVILQGTSDPSDTLGVGYYGAGLGHLGSWQARSDWDVQVFWELRNLGIGNRGLVRERQGQQKQATIELFRIQDQVAADVTTAQAQVEASAERVRHAEHGLKSALSSYEGNLTGLSETVRAGDLLQLVIRPQEAVAALDQLRQAYTNYYIAVADYNRAQFLLFRALGYPAEAFAGSDGIGQEMPVDLNRPAPLNPAW
jgi:outer membrane protein TolC